MVSVQLALVRVLIATWWWSVGLGACIGALYIALSLLAGRYAMRQAPGRFFLVVFGAMLVRLVMTLVLVVLVLALAPVEKAPFIGAFFGVFVIGLAVEVLYLHRARPTRNDSL